MLQLLRSVMYLVCWLQPTKTFSPEKTLGMAPGSRRAGMKSCTIRVSIQKSGDVNTLLSDYKLSEDLTSFVLSKSIWILLTPINMKRTLSYERRLNKLWIFHVSHFLQFLSFSTWIPGSWSRQRLPRCSEMRRWPEDDMKWHPSECYITPKALLPGLELSF